MAGLDDFERGRFFEHEYHFIIHVESDSLHQLRYDVAQKMMSSCSYFNDYNVSVETPEIIGSKMKIVYYFEERHRMFQRSNPKEVFIQIYRKESKSKKWFQKNSPIFFVHSKWIKQWSKS